MKAKINYGLIEEGLYIGRPAIFLNFGEGEDLKINEIIDMIKRLEHLNKCKRLMIDETKEKRHLELIKILIGLENWGLEVYLITDCTLIPHYNLRGYIKEWHVKLNEEEKSTDALMFFEGTLNVYFYVIKDFRMGLPGKKNIILMPEGKTFKEYKRNLKKAAKLCQKHGYILGTRIYL